MKTTFSAALQICGLSQSQAAEFLGVRPDTVKSWGAGRNPPPAGVWDMLADLYARIEMAADDARDRLPDNVLILDNIEADDEDGLPGDGPAISGAMALLRQRHED